MWEDLGSTLFWWIFFSCESFSPESLLGSRNLSGWSQTPLNVTYNYKVFYEVELNCSPCLWEQDLIILWSLKEDYLFNTLFQVRPLAKEKTENKTNSFGNFIAKPQRESLNYFSNPDNSTKMLEKSIFERAKSFHLLESINIGIQQYGKFTSLRPCMRRDTCSWLEPGFYGADNRFHYKLAKDKEHLTVLKEFPGVFGEFPLRTNRVIIGKWPKMIGDNGFQMISFCRFHEFLKKKILKIK